MYLLKTYVENMFYYPILDAIGALTIDVNFFQIMASIY